VIPPLAPRASNQILRRDERAAMSSPRFDGEPWEAKAEAARRANA
jgi:hypothetical protein